MMKYSAFSIIIAGFLTPLPLAAVEFNINAIDKDQRGNVDLSQFKDKNHVAPGHYFVNVAINNTPLANGWQLAWYKKTIQRKSAFRPIWRTLLVWTINTAAC